jgi:hypothetical protein
MKKCGIFEANICLLNLEEYEVQTQVPEGVFEEFVNWIQGGRITVCDENLNSLKLLSAEFDCEVLAKECDEFARSHSSDSQTTIEYLTALSKRISDLEERSLLHERGSAMAQDSIQSFFDKTESIESEICRISEFCDSLEAENADLGTRVDGLESLEQSHANLIADLKAEKANLGKRIDWLESLEQRHENLGRTLTSQNANLRERLGVLELRERERFESLEQRQDNLSKTLTSENAALGERLSRLESEERKRLESLQQRHDNLSKALTSENANLRERLVGLESFEQMQGELIEGLKAENSVLSERLGGLESLEQKHENLIETVKTETAALRAKLGRLESEERKRLGALEQAHGHLLEAVTRENANLIESVGWLESEERERIESLEHRHGNMIDAVKADNAALGERVDGLEARKKIPLQPLGILRFLKQRNYVVRITASSTHEGSTDSLLVDDGHYWASHNVPHSWIQWTIAGGLKVVISSVKIKGSVGHSGVKNFIIDGSNNSAVWTRIFDSNTDPTTGDAWVTQAEPLPQPNGAFSMIRLTQTGPQGRQDGKIHHTLRISYVEFGGKIIFPAMGK